VRRLELRRHLCGYPLLTSANSLSRTGWSIKTLQAKCSSTTGKRSQSRDERQLFFYVPYQDLHSNLRDRSTYHTNSLILRPRGASPHGGPPRKNAQPESPRHETTNPRWEFKLQPRRSEPIDNRFEASSEENLWRFSEQGHVWTVEPNPLLQRSGPTPALNRYGYSAI
jgi:hypothetical protein